MTDRRYDHTQHAPLSLLLLVLVPFCIVAAAASEDPAADVALALVAVLFITLSFAFMRLTVRDAGDALELRYGPLPLFQKRIPYEHIRAAEPARSRWIDGWGIHWVPGRGWTWNLWGFGCVELDTARGLVRVGTDEPERLAAFLRAIPRPDGFRRSTGSDAERRSR